MKKKHLFLLVIAFILLFSCSPSSEDAVKYNDRLIDEQLKITLVFDSLNYCLDSNFSEKLIPIQKRIFNQIELSINTVNKIEDFDKNDNYKKNIRKLFEVYKDVINNEYNKIIKNYLLPDSLFTKVEETSINTDWNNAYTKISNQLIEFNKFQEEFSKKYNFKLEEAE